MIVSMVAIAAPAAACPDCAIGKQARTLAWSDGFAQNLIASVLPFLFVAVIAFWVDRTDQS
jgi:hypothetical protein